jgi:hypothetical protein
VGNSPLESALNAAAFGQTASKQTVYGDGDPSPAMVFTLLGLRREAGLNKVPTYLIGLNYRRSLFF